MRLSHAAVAPTALVALVALVAVVLPAAPAHADDYDPRRPRPSDRFVVLRAGESLDLAARLWSKVVGQGRQNAYAYSFDSNRTEVRVSRWRQQTQDDPHWSRRLRTGSGVLREVTMQRDCNLVAYGTRKAGWDSGTVRRGRVCQLEMQVDGRLVVYDVTGGGHVAIWANR